MLKRDSRAGPRHHRLHRNEEAPDEGGALLGSGVDIAGRQVAFSGYVWTVKGKNYLGDWEVARRENRATASVEVTSSVAAAVLPVAHPHYAVLLPRR